MTTASGQARPDNAGVNDALSKAFDAALESTDMDEAKFPEAANAPAEKAAKEPVERETEQAVEAEPGDVEKEAQPAKPSQEAEPALTPPAHWDAPRREAFGKLNPAGQKIVMETVKALEGEFTRKSTEHAEKVRLADGIQSLISDEHKRQMRASGMDEVGGISYLLRLNDWARARPAEYASWFVQSTGLDPRQLFPQHFAGSTQPPAQPNQGMRPNGQVDPNVQLNSALAPLITRVEGITKELQQGKLRSADRAIASFKDAKAGDGTTLLHPHLPAVERDVATLLQTPPLQAIEDMGERLQRAYDIAVANDPNLRTQSFEAEVQRRMAEQQNKDRQKAEADKARKARAPARSAPAGPVSAKPKSLDETLRHVMSESGV